MAHSPAPLEPGNIIEQVITAGNLQALSAEDRTRYYVEVCRSVGLNPMTQPFAYITLNGKMVLYALRGCTDQLRTNRGVSVEDMTETERDGVFIVTCKVKDKDGRTDMAKGAVPIANLKGEALANAIMKAETKAKRRATLSLCGLGMLDESELETIPAARPLEAAAPVGKAPAATSTAASPGRSSTGNPPIKPLPPPPPPAEIYDPETGELSPHEIAVGRTANDNNDWISWGRAVALALGQAQTRADGEAWLLENDALLNDCQNEHPGVHKKLELNIAQMRERLPDFMAAQ